MRHAQQRTLDSLRRAQDFLRTHEAVLGAIPKSATSQELTAAIDAASAHHVSQGSANRTLIGEISRQRALAKQLVDSHMRPITKFARGKLRGVPDYAALTETVDPLNTSRLLIAARTMAETAAKYAGQFASAGLAGDTVERLKGATDALAAAVDHRSHAKGLRLVSTTSIEKALIAGRDAVRVLDAQISQALPSGDAVLAAWRMVSRVEGKTGKTRSVASSAPAVATEVKV